MRLLSVLANVFLAVVAMLGLMSIVPRVYQQARFQVTDPRGGDAMWPMTFQGFVFIAAFVAFLAAFSFLFNHRAGRILRLTSSAAVGCLLGSWLYSGVLFQRDYVSSFGPSDFSYPPLAQMTVFVDMFRFDGLAFLLIAIGMLSVPIVTGRGPVSLAVDFVKRYAVRRREREDAV